MLISVSEKACLQPPPPALLFQDSRRKKQRNAILPVPPQQGRSSTKRPHVHQQELETDMGLSGKEIENKIKWGLIQKANVCRDKATAGIVISQIVLIWANSASETVTVVFMLRSLSWPYLASLAPLNMGQTFITLHQRSVSHHLQSCNPGIRAQIW